MPLFLCSRRDELCKNDPCLSLADVRLRIEQEFRPLQVLGGNKGIAKSSECLEEYFLSTTKMSNIISDFCEKFGIAEDEARKRENITNFRNQRIAEFKITKSVSCFIRAMSVLMAHIVCSIF